MRLLLFILVVFMSLSVSANDILKGSLAVGEKAKDFTLPNAYEKNINLYEELEKGPVVLSFYRGGWCPVCNKQLYGFQENLSKIEKLDAQLIAVSPETPSNAEVTAVKNHLKFEVLSDHANKVAREYGIVWMVPERDQQGLDGWLKEATGKTLEDYNDQKGFELPVPATFVIAQDGEVVFAFKDVDYTKRADIQDVLNALKEVSE